MSRRVVIAAIMLSGLACEPGKTIQPAPSGENHAPTAFFGGPVTVDEGTTVTFDAGGSSDPDGDTLRYTWAFGDGLAGAGKTPQHQYRDNCTCAVSLVVSDSRGGLDTASLVLEVKNVAPTITSLYLSPGGVAIQTPVTLDLFTSDRGTADALTVSVDWGDGHSDHLLNHLYAKTGVFTVTVTVRDDDGAADTLTRENAVWTYDPSGRQSGYEAIDLGTLGGNSARPMALNDNGQVVGYSETAFGQTHAFLWENGVMRDINGSFNLSWAQTITNSGLIGGIVMDSLTRVVVWNQGVATELGDLGNPYGWSTVVALTSTDVVAWRGALPFLNSAIWQNGTRHDLGTLNPNSTATQARAMNSRRQIIGSTLMHNWGRLTNHAFIWENGAMRDLGVLYHFPCSTRPTEDCGAAEANEINNDGIVVGMSLDPSLAWHAVRWANGSIMDFGVGTAVGINDAGDIIINSSTQGVFWRDGKAVTLEAFGKNYTYLVDINGQGVTTGMSLTPDNKPHVFVWTPGQIGLTDLGFGSGVGNVNGGIPIAMNARGDVIGYAWPNADGVGLKGPWRAILWRKKP